jgi:hypothetical protein
MCAKPESVRRNQRAVLFPLSCLAVALSLAIVGPAAGAANAARARGAFNSANKIVVWTACFHVLKLTNEQLDAWHDRGVRGFACNLQRLPGMGTTGRYTGDTKHLGGSAYVLERSLRNSEIVARAHRRGMKMFLGFYFANANNPATPLADWFDDDAWKGTVLPAVHDVAAAALALGFDGLAFDQELYPQTDGGQTASWRWNYPGNKHSEAETRAKARQRGQELMRTILGAYPDVDILSYFTKFPGSWDELVQEEVNDASAAFRDWVQIDLWNGMTEVEGYDRITFLNATFYKTPHVGTWDSAYTYEYNSLFALLSRRFTNWAYAASRVQETPFVWISSGTTSFESARPPSVVAEQLDAARRWGMGRMFANYAYGELQGFDYGPYEDAMRAASGPGVVDDNPPTVAIQAPGAAAGNSIEIDGSAHDDYAVRFVRWRTDDGKAGMAELNWDPGPGNPQNGWKAWKTKWTAKGVPLHSGSNTVTVTVEDIKGLRTVKTVKVVG